MRTKANTLKLAFGKARIGVRNRWAFVHLGKVTLGLQEDEGLAYVHGGLLDRIKLALLILFK